MGVAAISNNAKKECRYNQRRTLVKLQCATNSITNVPLSESPLHCIIHVLLTRSSS